MTNIYLVTIVCQTNICSEKKGIQHHESQENAYNYVLITLPKNINKLIIPSVEHLEVLHIFFFFGNAKQYSLFEKEWGNFKVKLNIQLSSPYPRYLPKLEEKPCLHKTCM